MEGSSAAPPPAQHRDVGCTSSIGRGGPTLAPLPRGGRRGGLVEQRVHVLRALAERAHGVPAPARVLEQAGEEGAGGRVRHVGVVLRVEAPRVCHLLRVHKRGAAVSAAAVAPCAPCEAKM